MVEVEVSVDIDRPVHDVFVFVEDETNMPAWDADLVKATRTSDGPVAVGSTFHLDIKPFMGATQGDGTVVAHEVDRLIELQFDMGRMKPHVWHRFETSTHGTRFIRRVEVAPGGILKLMSPMMGPMIRKRNVAYLAKLKVLLEQPS